MGVGNAAKEDNEEENEENERSAVQSYVSFSLEKEKEGSTPLCPLALYLLGIIYWVKHAQLQTNEQKTW